MSTPFLQQNLLMNAKVTRALRVAGLRPLEEPQLFPQELVYVYKEDNPSLFSSEQQKHFNYPLDYVVHQYPRSLRLVYLFDLGCEPCEGDLQIFRTQWDSQNFIQLSDFKVFFVVRAEGLRLDEAYRGVRELKKRLKLDSSFFDSFFIDHTGRFAESLSMLSSPMYALIDREGKLVAWNNGRLQIEDSLVQKAFATVAGVKQDDFLEVHSGWQLFFSALLPIFFALFSVYFGLKAKGLRHSRHASSNKQDTDGSFKACNKDK